MARNAGRPRKTDYPARIGPYRATPATWDLLDTAATVSGRTKREIVETAVASLASAIIDEHQPTGGTDNGSGQAQGEGEAREGTAAQDGR